MNTLMKEALDDARRTGRNVLFIGPVIGKSTSIKEWARKNKLNLYHMLPWQRIDPLYTDLDIQDGVMLIESKLPHELNNRTIPMIQAICNGENPELLLNETPTILFKVVILSAFSDCIKENEAIIEMLKDRSDWTIVWLNYDKKEILTFFIDEFKKTASSSEQTQGLIGFIKEDVVENPEDYSKEYFSDMKSPTNEEAKKYLMREWTVCKRGEAILSHLLNCPDFNINSRELDGWRLGEWMHKFYRTSGMKEEFLEYWEGKDCYASLVRALDDYEDPDPIYNEADT